MYIYENRLLPLFKSLTTIEIAKRKLSKPIHLAIAWTQLLAHPSSSSAPVSPVYIRKQTFFHTLLLFFILAWFLRCRFFGGGCLKLILGISAGKILAENGIEDILILEASDRIGGRVRNEKFGGVSVELGAGWIAGVGGKESNPVWELASKSGLRTCFSDYTNARYNIYDRRFFFLYLF